MNLRNQEEQAKIAANRKKRPQAQHHDAPSSKAATVEPDTPSRPKTEVWVDVPLKLEASTSGRGVSDHTRGGSPASVASSASEAPLAQTVKINGGTHGAQASHSASADHQVTKSETSNSPQGTSTPASAPHTNRRVSQLRSRRRRDSVDSSTSSAGTPEVA